MTFGSRVFGLALSLVVGQPLYAQTFEGLPMGPGLKIGAGMIFPEALQPTENAETKTPPLQGLERRLQQEAAAFQAVLSGA
jgi:hypothetical protein